MDSLKDCIVRITDAQGEILGTGFLLNAEGLVATCYHVVKEDVQAAFPNEAPRPARLWKADPAHDVALLQLQGKLPPNACPVLLGPSKAARSRNFRTFGYRPLDGWEGIPAEGQVLDAVLEAPGHSEVRFPPLILQSQHLRGGMSGAPVYIPELDRVVGMVTAHWDALAARTGFVDRDTALATPSEAIVALAPEVLALHPPDVRQILRHYPGLRDHLVDFDIAEHTRRFVGREFVFRDWLEPFLTRNPCGYLRLTAEAGLGKTAIAAEVARRYHAPAFFLNASRGLVRADRCLNHLCAEVIGRYDLPYDYLPERAGEDSSFFLHLLEEAAKKVSSSPQQEEAKKRVLVVIDALDEADPVPPGRNWLLLPDRLPRGVYIFLTQRPGDYLLRTDPDTPVEEREIVWDQPEQQEDIEKFLRQEAGREEIRRALDGASPPISIDSFAAAMKRASEGNFMYLTYVLADISHREPGFDPLRLEELPRGLSGYYAQFWTRMEEARDREGWKEWKQLYRPTVELLGVAREPVTAEWLAAQIGREAEEVQERVLERWRRFLRSERRDGDETWRIVHRSFADFLAEKVDLAATHRRIAERYIRLAGGDRGRLAGVDGGYGIRHLGAHLAGAGQWEDLHLLVATGAEKQPWAEARYAVEGNYAGYLADLELAWRRAEEKGKEEPVAMGRQVRYALIESAIHSLAGNIPPELLVAAVEKGVWKPEAALAYARQVPDPGQRARALSGLAPHLPPDLKEQVLREALAAAQEIRDEFDRAEALSGLAPHLPPELLREALAAAQEIETDSDRARALSGLAPHLPPELLREALAAAQEIRDADDRARALSGLAPRWAEWVQKDRDAAYAPWPETLHALAGRPRKDLLSDIRALSPVLAALGGAEAVQEALRAVQDVGRWWP